MKNYTSRQIAPKLYREDTGLACALQYNPETGRLFEVHAEDTFDNEEIGF